MYYKWSNWMCTFENWCEFYYVRTNLAFCCGDIVIHIFLKWKYKKIFDFVAKRAIFAANTAVFKGISCLELKGKWWWSFFCMHIGMCWCTFVKILPFCRKIGDDEPKKGPPGNTASLHYQQDINNQIRTSLMKEIREQSVAQNVNTLQTTKKDYGSGEHVMFWYPSWTAQAKSGLYTMLKSLTKQLSSVYCNLLDVSVKLIRLFIGFSIRDVPICLLLALVSTQIISTSLIFMCSYILYLSNLSRFWKVKQRKVNFSPTYLYIYIEMLSE